MFKGSTKVSPAEDFTGLTYSILQVSCNIMEVSVAVHHFVLLGKGQHGRSPIRRNRPLVTAEIVRVDQPTGSRSPPTELGRNYVVIGDERFELNDDGKIYLGIHSVVIPGGEDKGSSSMQAIYSDIYGYVKLVPGTVYSSWFKSTAVAFPHPVPPSLGKKILYFLKNEIFQIV